MSPAFTARLPTRPIQRAAIAAMLLLTPTLAPALWVGDNRPPFQAQAPLNFSLSVDKFLFLQVGSAGPQIDTISFNLNAWVSSFASSGGAAPVGLGDGTPIPASSNGSLTILVRGNNGAITLSATNTGAGLGMSNGAGGYLNYNQVLTQSDNTGLPPPVLSNAGGTSVTVSATAYGGKVTDQSANWTYQLANSVVPAPGNYTGSVTYTAAMP